MTLPFASRMVCMVAFLVVGWRIGEFFAGPSTGDPWVVRPWYSLSLAGGALGLLLGPYLTIHPFLWLRRQIQQVSASALAAGTLGLVLGLFIAVLLALPLSTLPGELGHWLPLASAVFWSWSGITVMVLRQEDMVHAWSALWPGNHGAGLSLARGAGAAVEVVVDTSSIIDGRIADIALTGFIPGTLVVPGFVLDELRHIADSADPMKRNRGRRGLDVLARLQREQRIPIRISDMDFEDTIEVDAKLVRLCKRTSALLLTNDYNLNRVAEFQSVRVLNINDLTAAVKLIALPGEELRVKIVQEGQQVNQGVGFLDDGTMVVVDNGKRYIGMEVLCTVTRVLQTAQGRIIFAALREPAAS